MIVGIEVGGTFTDLVMANADGSLTVHKLPSTPSDPSVAAVNGLEALLKCTNSEAQGVAELLHGSTIAANALIQRRGAATVLLTTRGFRDVLFIQRQGKSTVYDMFYSKPEPLLTRDCIYEVEERLGADGGGFRADVVVMLRLLLSSVWHAILRTSKLAAVLHPLRPTH